MYRYSEDNRVFNYAVAASIVLHAMLLFGVSQRDRARPAEPRVPLVIPRADPAPAAAAPVAPAAAEVEDPGSLAKYRQQLILAAPRYKRYPRIAQDNNWQGNVAVRMVIGPGGTVSALTVLKSSGYHVLDQQAQEMFRNAAAVDPVPPALRGKQRS